MNQPTSHIAKPLKTPNISHTTPKTHQKHSHPSDSEEELTKNQTKNGQNKRKKIKTLSWENSLKHRKRTCLPCSTLTQTTPKHLQTWLVLAPNQKTTKKPHTKRLRLE